MTRLAADIRRSYHLTFSCSQAQLDDGRLRPQGLHAQDPEPGRVDDGAPLRLRAMLVPASPFADELLVGPQQLETKLTKLLSLALNAPIKCVPSATGIYAYAPKFFGMKGGALIVV